MLTTTQAAQVHQTATHAEHATHRDDSRLSVDRSLSKTVQSLFCFLVLVSSLVLVPYGMGGFHHWVHGASTESALLALLGRFERSRSRLRSDECVMSFWFFDFYFSDVCD